MLLPLTSQLTLAVRRASRMHLLDLTLPDLASNLALDEAMLLDAEAGGPEVLRFWSWPSHAVILGAGGKLAEDVHEDACLADSVPIQRRSSGGGTVLLGSGCLCYSLVLSFDRDAALSDLHASYRYILGRIQYSLPSPLRGKGAGGEGESFSLQGSSDLALGDRKFSGNAQQRKRTHLLHHGTILHAFDFAPVSRYLKTPARQPEYRQRRRHADFLTNLPLDIEVIRQSLRDAWQAKEALSQLPTERVSRLVAERYGREDWIRRR